MSRGWNIFETLDRETNKQTLDCLEKDIGSNTDKVYSAENLRKY